MQAYITRIQAVNGSLNAVLDNRFEQALKDAKHADSLIAKANDEQLIALFRRYPLLGIPFTVKESAGLKGELKTVDRACIELSKLLETANTYFTQTINIDNYQ